MFTSYDSQPKTTMGHALTGRASVRIVGPLKALTETGRGFRAFREPQAIDCEPGQAAAATFTREPTGERPPLCCAAGSVVCSAGPGVSGHNERPALTRGSRVVPREIFRRSRPWWLWGRGRILVWGPLAGVRFGRAAISDRETSTCWSS